MLPDVDSPRPPCDERASMARDSGERRERILASAAALFASKGVAATTVREIADEVGMLSGSLYHHFDSKEAMVDEIVTSYLEDLRARYKGVVARDTDPRTKLHDLVVVSLEVVEAHPHATEIYQNDVNYLTQIERFSYLKNAGKEVQSTWLDVINAGVRQGVFRRRRRSQDPLPAHARRGVAVGALVQADPRLPDRPLRRGLHRLFLDGLAPRPLRLRVRPSGCNCCAEFAVERRRHVLHRPLWIADARRRAPPGARSATVRRRRCGPPGRAPPPPGRTAGTRRPARCARPSCRCSVPRARVAEVALVHLGHPGLRVR